MRDIAHVGFLGLDEVVLGSIKRRKVIIQRILASACENDRSVVRNKERVTTQMCGELSFDECGGGGRCRDEEIGVASRIRDVTYQSLDHFILHHSV